MIQWCFVMVGEGRFRLFRTDERDGIASSALRVEMPAGEWLSCVRSLPAFRTSDQAAYDTALAKQRGPQVEGADDA